MSYYISPRFLNKIALHITKNFLELPAVRVPLILGIHGRKGEGKSFQCELAFEKMGVEVVHMSAGELESPDAGDPARLIRLRYREAAELIKVRGQMVVLMINDLDAGAGRMDRGTQYTVNTQLVHGTLMNIADHPTDVQLPGSYDQTPLHRVPIIVTGNDFSTLYAPLIRDGRMEKFYWEPDLGDRIGIVGGIFSEDGLSERQIERLVDAFPHQAIDFFGAVRSRLWDEQILEFIHNVGLEKVSARVVNSADKPPEFQKPTFTLEQLLEIGNLMAGEQTRVETMRLAREYNENSYTGVGEAIAPETRQQQHSTLISPLRDRSVSSTPHSETRSQNNGGTSSNSQPHSSQLTPDVTEQLQQLLKSGYRIGIEYADRRRFRTSSWKSAESIPASELSETIAAIETILKDHSGEYVRLIGIEPQAKRRVVESIIQRP